MLVWETSNRMPQYHNTHALLLCDNDGSKQQIYISQWKHFVFAEINSKTAFGKASSTHGVAARFGTASVPHRCHTEMLDGLLVITYFAHTCRHSTTYMCLYGFTALPATICCESSDTRCVVVSVALWLHLSKPCFGALADLTRFRRISPPRILLGGGVAATK